MQKLGAGQDHSEVFLGGFMMLACCGSQRLGVSLVSGRVLAAGSLLWTGLPQPTIFGTCKAAPQATQSTFISGQAVTMTAIPVPSFFLRCQQ